MASPQKMGFYVSTTRANSGIFIAIDSPHISKRKLNIPAHLLSWRGGAKGCNSLLPKDLAAANFKPCSAGYALIDVVLLDNAPLSLCTMSNWLSPTPSQERRQKKQKKRQCDVLKPCQMLARRVNLHLVTFELVQLLPYRCLWSKSNNKR